MVIDHIGVVVKNIEDGITQWEDQFGYFQATDPILNKKQKVRVVFMDKADSVMVKLVEPSGEDSPVYQFALKGGGLHHLCFRCDDLESQINELRKQGVRCFVPPESGEAFENNKIAFLISSNNLNIELIDTDKKTGYKLVNVNI